jgi:hypothetical protein
MNAEHESLYFLFVHGTDLRRHLRHLINIISKIVPFLGRWRLKEPGQWYRIGSPLRETLHDEFPTAKFGQFAWSGALNQYSRFEAAKNLSQTLGDATKHHRHVCIITHSHGGNIALQAMTPLSTPNIYLITLVCPFIHFNMKRSESRAQRLAFGSTAILTSLLTLVSFLTGMISILQFLLILLLLACVFYAFMFIPKHLLNSISSSFFIKERVRYDGICSNPCVHTLILTHELDEFHRLSRFIRRTTNVKASIKVFDRYLSFFSFTKYVIIICGFALVWKVALGFGLNTNTGYAIGLAAAVGLVVVVGWGFIGVIVQACITVIMFTYGILKSDRIASINPIEAVAVSCSTKSVVPIRDASPTPQHIEYKNFGDAPTSGRWAHTDFSINEKVIDTICQWIHSQLTSCNL